MARTPNTTPRPDEPSTDDGEGQIPRLEDLGEHELIECVNPELGLRWFYGFVNGELMRYHQSHGFGRTANQSREDAEKSIAHEKIEATVVDFDVLVETRDGHDDTDRDQPPIPRCGA